MPTDDRARSAATLEGRVALVTGGASGIGRAAARRLAAAGASIVLADLDDERGREVAEGLGGQFVRADVGDPDAWPEVIAAAEDRFGGLDVAFLNAGVTTGASLLSEVTDDAYRRIMRVNVDAVLFGARAVAPLLKRRGGGAIVATASLAGLIAYSPDPVYAATKHAVVGLVRALAPQLEADHITVNAICPGLVDTPLLGEQAKALVQSAGFPLIDPEAIAKAVYERVVGAETGQAWVCQAGREAIRYRFSGVPGPAGSGLGRTPPEELRAYDQRARPAD